MWLTAYKFLTFIVFFFMKYPFITEVIFYVLCKFACVQTFISFVVHGTKEIEDICMQAMCKYVKLK